MDKDIAELSRRHLYFGTSSWKYEGWRGLLYEKPYRTDKAFKDECLTEYADHYPTVGVDHTYYAWPTEKIFAKYIEQTPSDFSFGLKVTEKITVFQYPKLKRYGKDAGKKNELFLNPEALIDNFLKPLEPFRNRLGVLMLEFSQFYPGAFSSGREFLDRLDTFFSSLGEYREYPFAVEIRNQNWVKPPYFELLAKHSVGHVFNSWTRMPPISEQLKASQGIELPRYVSRLLLAPGTKYEEAVEAFAPYDELQEPHPEIYDAIIELLDRAVQAGVPAYVFVNNRFEGCAPLTIATLAQKYLKRIKSHS